MRTPEQTGYLPSLGVTSDFRKVNIADMLERMSGGSGGGVPSTQIVDANGNPLFSIDNPANVQLSGSSLQEQLTQDDADNGVLTFSEPIGHIEIYNTDETNLGVFTVNGISITLPPKNSFKSAIGGTPSNQVTVTGAMTYIVSRYA